MCIFETLTNAHIHNRVPSAIWAAKEMQELQAKPTEQHDLNLSIANVLWSFDLMILITLRKRRELELVTAYEKFQWW